MSKPAILGGTPVRDTKLYYGHQYIDDADIQAVVDVLKSDYLTCGPKITELEEKLCKLTGAKYAVVCSNGTAALHMACMAAGVEPGDEVITTPITFAASANCALYCGAKPIFADINEKTYNIDPEKVKEVTTDRTKAIVAVDFTGQSVELDQLAAHCKEHNLVFLTGVPPQIAGLFISHSLSLLNINPLIFLLIFQTIFFINKPCSEYYLIFHYIKFKIEEQPNAIQS